MIKTIKKIIAVGCCLCLSFQVSAQRNWSNLENDVKTAVNVDTINKSKFTLVFINKSQDFDPKLQEKLIGVFFTNYPKQVKKYNKEAIRKVVFVIDPAYKGVAAAAAGVIRFNPEWFKKNPGDIDVVTHETMHLVQNYPNNAGPGWITEGIADFVRYDMGIDNKGANWRLPDFSQTHSYENAYRITARFFAWIEKNRKKGFVKKLDAAMRNRQYSEEFWKENTGLNLDELWAEYAKNPQI